jgi:hypothetical protein
MFDRLNLRIMKSTFAEATADKSAIFLCKGKENRIRLRQSFLLRYRYGGQDGGQV